MYRLMQLSQTTIPVAASYTHLFSHNRTYNRVEFLTDFPVGDDAEVISSLQVHPQGWCALSRNITNGEKSEWTCIHDIQERDMSECLEQAKEAEETPQFNESTIEEFEDSQRPQSSRSGITSSFVIESANRARFVRTVSDVRPNSFSSTENSQPMTPSRTWRESTRRNARSQSRSPRPTERNIVRTNFGVVEVSSSVTGNESRTNASQEEDRQEGGYMVAGEDNSETAANDESVDDRDRDGEQEYRPQRSNSQLNNLGRPDVIGNFFAANVELYVNNSDVWEALVAIREARIRRDRAREFIPASGRRDWLFRSDNGISVNIPRSSHTVVIIGDRTRVQNQNRQGQQTMYAIPRNHKIHQNIPRLTHYIEEPNVGSGYIKELCFSADGRLICSPFGYGVRFLAFSSDCAELSNCVPPTAEPMQLCEVATSLSHGDIVVSTKFSPKHCLVVSGCLSGKIVWHQPVL